MKQPSKKQTNVRLGAADGLTEISIVDSSFKEIATGIGRLHQALPPGIYKARWKTGSATSDELFEVTGAEEDGVLELTAAQLDITSSAPLDNTQSGNLEQPNYVRDLSLGAPTLGADKPAQVLLFLRDDEPADEPVAAQSVTLHHADGTELIRLDAGEVNPTDRTAGLLVGLYPGVYRLRVETDELGSYEIFVTTAPHWQTQVFLQSDDFYLQRRAVRRPALRSASILMGRIGEGFNPASRDSRLAELALAAMVRNADVLDAGDMQDLLHGKFHDPMLGIYGAHLLLSRHRVNWELFDTVCGNLLNIVGPIPDVLALLTRSKGLQEQLRAALEDYEGLPPMLLRSWDLLIRHSRKRSSIVPPGSIADRVADTVVSTRPWFMSKVDQREGETQTSSAVSVALGNRLLKQLAARMGEASPDEVARLTTILLENDELNPVESAILDAMRSLGDVKNRQLDRWRLQMDATDADSDELADIATGAISKLRIPSYSLARSTVSLATKLQDQLNLEIE